MPSKGDKWRKSVFFNVPFDRSYEPLFVALISSVVALGRTPRCVLEIPEMGDGRLFRILRLLRSCASSIHDLSRVGVPVRFNMPFELGIAFAISRIQTGHGFVIMEAKKYRLDQTLSDVKGMDPAIHGASVNGAVSCILSHFGRPQGGPSPQSVAQVRIELWRLAVNLKKNYGRSTIYSRAIFRELVVGASFLARKNGLIGE
jgi:hypothetical protein